MWNQLRTAGLMLLTFTVLTGLVYPLAITGISQVAFSQQANGSLITRSGKPIGSELIGQPFDDPKYFWSRPSATTPFPYNAGSSSGSNLAVTNPAQFDAIRTRIAKLRDSGVSPATPMPVDLVTASGSGLDPLISVAAADVQVSRIARTRGLPEDRVRQVVRRCMEGRQWGVLGEPRVNVLKLNLELDAAAGGTDGAGPG